MVDSPTKPISPAPGSSAAHTPNPWRSICACVRSIQASDCASVRVLAKKRMVWGSAVMAASGARSASIQERRIRRGVVRGICTIVQWSIGDDTIRPEAYDLTRINGGKAQKRRNDVRGKAIHLRWRTNARNFLSARRHRLRLIGLSGAGRLIDWEMLNRPNKGSTNGISHFAVRAERSGKMLRRAHPERPLSRQPHRRFYRRLLAQFRLRRAPGLACRDAAFCRLPVRGPLPRGQARIRR